MWLNDPLGEKQNKTRTCLCGRFIHSPCGNDTGLGLQGSYLEEHLKHDKKKVDPENQCCVFNIHSGKEPQIWMKTVAL